MRIASRTERRRVRTWWGSLGLVAVWILLGAGFGCKEDPIANGGNGEIPLEPVPFDIFDISLRPAAIDRPPLDGGPAAAADPLALTAFYEGGREPAVFTWSLQSDLGRIESAGPGLTLGDATVQLRVRDDGLPALGFYPVSVRGRSGSERDSVERRLAVVENSWVKHERVRFTGVEPPEELVQSPVFFLAGAETQILFVESPNPAAKLARIKAYGTLLVGEQGRFDVMRPPTSEEENNFASAPKVTPDPAPPELGRSEILFASQMDVDYDPRGCTPCRSNIPYTLWVVPNPDPVNTFVPRVLVRDAIPPSNFFTAPDYLMPRWDPSARGASLRIAYLSNRVTDASVGPMRIWLADLVDHDANGTSDELVNRRPLDNTAGAAHFAWHPDGTRIAYVASGSLHWVDVGSGAVADIVLPDPNLSRVQSVSVWWRAGESTLLAFQASQTALENLTNLYVLNLGSDPGTADDTVTRVLPFPFPPTHILSPRWHPQRKEIVYIGDYGVGRWSDQVDILNPERSEDAGQRRTRFPSPWIVKLED